MDYNLKNENEEPQYKILKNDEKETYENAHPVFDNKGENLDDRGYLISYSKIYEEKGFIIGLENRSNLLFKLKLKLKELYDIDGDFNIKDNIEFEILPNSKKVFNLRIKPGAKDPGFEFIELE